MRGSAVEVATGAAGPPTTGVVLGAQPPSTAAANGPRKATRSLFFISRPPQPGWVRCPKQLMCRLDGLESAPAEHWWHDVVLDVRQGAPLVSAASKPGSKRATKPKSPRRR